jgi:hypothetical protein
MWLAVTKFGFTTKRNLVICIILIWRALISTCMDSENLVLARLAAKRALDSKNIKTKSQTQIKTTI